MYEIEESFIIHLEPLRFRGKDNNLSSKATPNYKHFEDVFYEKRVWVPSANVSNYLLMFTRPYIGDPGDLGTDAFRNLIITLSESEIVPRIVVFWNNAVRACVDQSTLLASIVKIEKAGVKILVSAHALESLNLKTKLRVGKLANNLDLLDAINKTQKVVSF